MKRMRSGVEVPEWLEREEAVAGARLLLLDVLAEEG